MTLSGDLRRFCLVLNFIILLESLTLIVRGIIIAKTWNRWAKVLGTGFDISSTTLTIIGSCLFLMTLFGFVALWVNGYGMLIIYSMVLFLLSSIMLIYGIYSWVDIQGDRSSIREKLQRSLGALPPYLLYDLELDLKCCGIDQFTDYHFDKSKAREFWGENIFILNEPDDVFDVLEISESKIEPKVKIFNSSLIQVEQTNQTTKKYFKKWFTAMMTTLKPLGYMFFKFDPRRPREKSTDAPLIHVTAEVTTEDGEKKLELATWPVTYSKEDPKSFSTVHDWEYRIKNQDGRWNISTPWGLSSGGYTILPQSCCKTFVPENLCYGSPMDTWQFGCRNNLDNYLITIYTEISLLLIGFSVTVCIAGFAALVFKKVIKQKYWFWSK